MNAASLLPKRPLLFVDIKHFDTIDKVIIESLEQALYRLVIEVQGQQYYIQESVGRSLTRRSIVEIQELLLPYKVESMYLSHSSPYDEMIGLSVNEESNEMLVPLGSCFKTTSHNHS